MYIIVGVTLKSGSIEIIQNTFVGNLLITSELEIRVHFIPVFVENSVHRLKVVCIFGPVKATRGNDSYIDRLTYGTQAVDIVSTQPTTAPPILLDGGIHRMNTKRRTARCESEGSVGRQLFEAVYGVPHPTRGN